MHRKNLHVNLLPQQKPKERVLTVQQQQFLDILFENGGNVTAAAVDAGYSRGSSQWLKKTLADEIVERTKDILSVNAIKAANRLVNTIDNPAPERGDDLRLKAISHSLSEQQHSNIIVLLYPYVHCMTAA